MKHEEDDKTFFSADLGHLVVLVRVFEHGSWKAAMPPGKALHQESETRFGTTFDFVERFSKAKLDAQSLISLKIIYAATDALSKLVSNTAMTNVERYPCLVEINEVFQPVLHMQTKMEGSKYPCIHLVMTMLEPLKNQLIQKSNGTNNSCTLTMPNVHTRRLSGVLVKVLENIEVHEVWISATIWPEELEVRVQC